MSGIGIGFIERPQNPELIQNLEERLAKVSSVDEAPPSWAASYEITILSRLLAEGCAVLWEIRHNLKSRHKDDFDGESFQIAARNVNQIANPE